MIELLMALIAAGAAVGVIYWLATAPSEIQEAAPSDEPEEAPSRVPSTREAREVAGS